MRYTNLGNIYNNENKINKVKSFVVLDSIFEGCNIVNYSNVSYKIVINNSYNLQTI